MQFEEPAKDVSVPKSYYDKGMKLGRIFRWVLFFQVWAMWVSKISSVSIACLHALCPGRISFNPLVLVSRFPKANK